MSIFNFNDHSEGVGGQFVFYYLKFGLYKKVSTSSVVYYHDHSLFDSDRFLPAKNLCILYMMVLGCPMDLLLLLSI